MTTQTSAPGTGGGPAQDDLEIASLIATRLCHDLSGPVGALAAGSEMLGDPDFLDETAALLAHSSAGAMARLRLLRAAFGVAGGGTTPFEETLIAYTDAVHGADATLGFRLDAPHLLDQGVLRQLALNMVLLVIDALPGRGTVHTSVSQTDQGPLIEVEVQAKRLTLQPATLDALNGARDSLSARTIQAYWLSCLARPFGGVELSQDQGTLRLSARLSSNGF
jgi:histidine phosphotransferase ChpT